MKRFWHTWLMMVAVATMVSTASAQSGSRSASEIGSYQSILSRAGYGDVNPGAGYAQPGPAYGCAAGGCGGGAQVAQPTFAQPQGSFGYQGGAPVDTFNAPVQQQFAPVQQQFAPVQQQFAPAQQQIAPLQSYQTAPLPVAAGPVDFGGGVSYGNVVSDGGAAYSAPAYSAPVYNAPAYSAPAYSAPAIYSPGSAIGGVGAIAGRARRGGGSNLVASVSALAFARDYEDRRLIARNPAGQLLFTNDADNDAIGGVEFALANRKQNGNGWEARYFGLFPDNASATLTGAQVSAVGLRGFDRLGFNGQPLDQFFANGTSQTVSRDTDINSLEFNLLRNGGRFSTRRGRQGNFELLGGFRYFEFDERFTYSTADGATPIDYTLEADNTLLGFQLGSRAEICATKRLRFAGGVRTGIFNNHVNTRQGIADPTGANFAQVTPLGGNPQQNFDFRDEQDDVAILSEIDLGLIFQFSQKARIRVGYRALGIAGVALATDQIPFEFDNLLATERANTNGDLLLHGGYVGTEFCF